MTSLIILSKDGLVIMINSLMPHEESCSICLTIIGDPSTSSKILVESLPLKPCKRVPRPPAAITVLILFIKFII